MSRVVLLYNGVKVPNDGYKMKYSKEMYMQPYRALFDQSGVGYKDTGNVVSYEQFKKGKQAKVINYTKLTSPLFLRFLCLHLRFYSR